MGGTWITMLGVSGGWFIRKSTSSLNTPPPPFSSFCIKKCTHPSMSIMPSPNVVHCTRGSNRWLATFLQLTIIIFSPCIGCTGVALAAPRLHWLHSCNQQLIPPYTLSVPTTLPPIFFPPPSYWHYHYRCNLEDENLRGGVTASSPWPTREQGSPKWSNLRKAALMLE